MKKTSIIAGGLSLLLAAACGGQSQGRATTPAPKVSVTRTKGVPAATVAAAAGPPAAGHRRPRPGPAALTWWHPSDAGSNNGPEFQWELDHPLSTSSAADMSGRTLNAAGHVASRATVYDIDGIDNPASTVAALHRSGAKVICYIEVGSAGDYYSAAREGIPVTYYAQLAAAGDLGSKVQGYPESYLNINAASTVSVIKSMIRQQCAAKGFDAVEPDIDDSYTNSTGYHITEAENERYDKMLGAYAHSLGLAGAEERGQRSGVLGGAEPTTDFLLTEECNFYRTCAVVTPPYVRAGKLVLNVEYTDDWGAPSATDLRRFCPADVSRGIDGTLFTSTLAGPRDPCQ